jgi:hypothetical protein
VRDQIFHRSGFHGLRNTAHHRPVLPQSTRQIWIPHLAILGGV